VKTSYIQFSIFVEENHLKNILYPKLCSANFKLLTNQIFFGASTALKTMQNRKATSSRRARAWCATHYFKIKNESKERFEALFASGNLTYLIMGDELGEQGENPHFQIYFYLKNAKTFDATLKMLTKFKLEGTHIEYTKGTNKEAYDYCKKEGTFWEYGTAPNDKHTLNKSDQNKGGQSTKRKYDNFIQLAEHNEEELVKKEMPGMYVNHYHVWKAIVKESQERPLPLTNHNNIWIKGLPGTGKSRYLRAKYPNAYLKLNNKWWENYKFEEEVLIEDVDPNTMKHQAHNIKTWSDLYVLRVECKGTSMLVRPKMILITSNYSIEECFEEKDIPAVLRRFTVIDLDNPILRAHYQAETLKLEEGNVELEKMRQMEALTWMRQREDIRVNMMTNVEEDEQSAATDKDIQSPVTHREVLNMLATGIPVTEELLDEAEEDPTWPAAEVQNLNGTFNAPVSLVTSPAWSYNTPDISPVRPPPLAHEDYLTDEEDTEDNLGRLARRRLNFDDADF
jgi:hypothetical protein